MKPTIRCSSLDRILNCAHSLRLPKHDFESTYATKGTEQHNLAEDYLKGRDVKTLDLNTKMYVEYVKDYNIEEQLEHDFKTFVLTGKPDAWHTSHNTLEIVDLKSGHMLVEPTSNQLKGYAALVLQKEDAKNIKLTIIQDCEIKTFEFESDGFVKGFINEINKSLENHTFETGDHCNFCPSKPHCLRMYTMLKDDNDVINIIRNKSILTKTMEEMEKVLLRESPELFIKTYRRYKKWIDEGHAPIEEKTMSVAKALKLGLADESMIEVNEKTYFKLKS